MDGIQFISPQWCRSHHQLAGFDGKEGIFETGSSKKFERSEGPRVCFWSFIAFYVSTYQQLGVSFVWCFPCFSCPSLFFHEIKRFRTTLNYFLIVSKLFILNPIILALRKLFKWYYYHLSSSSTFEKFLRYLFLNQYN